jgi:hypothetical protein
MVLLKESQLWSLVDMSPNPNLANLSCVVLLGDAWSFKVLFYVRSITYLAMLLKKIVINTC